MLEPARRNCTFSDVLNGLAVTTTQEHGGTTQNETKACFYVVAGFPRVIGAVDCTDC